MKPCEQTQSIHAYHDGELSPERAAAVESHLRGCPACEAELASLRATTARLRFAPRPRLDAAFLAQLHTRIDTHAKAGDEAGAFRMASWLTATAAAIAVACTVHLMTGGTTAQAATPAAWETTAMLAIADVRGGTASGEYKMAQLMRDDLASVTAVEDNHD
jgi:anti-sigma factor RsiW